MTLDEAIQHCYDVANKGCDECAEELEFGDDM